MFNEAVQKRAGLLIGISVFLVTVVVTPWSTLDPINVPKLWVLSAATFGLGGVLLTQFKTLFGKKNWFAIAPARSLFLLMAIALIASKTILAQELFGTYGRNTGLLTYFCFGTLFIGAAVATNRGAAKPFLIGTAAALAINVLYGVLQATGNDPFKWSNPYAPVIGTLGNPNFSAAFFGMGVAFALSYLVAKGSDLKIRIASIAYILIAIFDIAKSDAQQGIIVSLLSAGLIVYFLLKSKFSNPIIRFSYLGFGLIVTLVGILGTLQKGPLSSVLYKPSVTYRGDYWHAGIEMFKSHPWFGVGLDSYGDYYRATRTLEATLRRGPSTVSNAAHNVFIDIAATAGIFALLAYLAVIAVGMRAAWRISKRSNTFDPFFVSVFVAWIGYLVQSVISINNIALGIWGWVLPGLLVAIDRWQTEEKSVVKKSKSTDFTGMAMVGGIVIGGVIGFLPFNADATFRNALESGDPNKIYAAATKWPMDASRLNYAVQVFDQNKMQDKAVALARESVKLNPRNFDGWTYLYNSPSVSGNEKREILDRLKALDPHNPDLKMLG
jgi:O-antigen ligase